MASLRLPLSGDEVMLLPLVGADDAVIAESPTLGVGLAVDLLARVARGPDGRPHDWLHAALLDLDVALLSLRRLLRGDGVRADARCRTEGCGALADIAFRVSDYLAHHAPTRADDVMRDAQAGWFRLAEGGPRFRPPRVVDLLDASRGQDPVVAIVARCLDAPSPDPALLDRVARALEALSPSLYGELEGTCPECGAALTVPFDPVTFVLRELRARAVDVFADVHLIASRYHWTEEHILQLPSARRQRYVEQIRGGEA